MIGSKRTTCRVLFLAAAFLAAAMLGQSCADNKDLKRNHLDYFTVVSELSISSDGNQLIFTGCGHKDFPQYTLYRFNRKENILYRYLYNKKTAEIFGAQYWSDSGQVLFSIFPEMPDGEAILNDMQIAIMDEDGAHFKELTEGKGVKTAYMLSPDGKTLVYARAKEREDGRAVASHFDFYSRDLATRKETRLTNLCFYDIGTPYFTPDGKNIVFNYGYPACLPNVDDPLADVRFNKNYWEKYQNNRIIRYPVDGSGINRLPEPWFTHGKGSEDPIMMTNGSMYFRETSSGFRYYRRDNTGNISEFTKDQLGTNEKRYVYQQSISATGKWMAILYQYFEGDKDRCAAILDMSTGELIPLSLPATAINITIH